MKKKHQLSKTVFILNFFHQNLVKKKVQEDVGVPGRMKGR